MPAVTEFDLWWETYSPQGVDHWRGYEQAKAAWDEGCNAGAGHERERASKLEETAPSASTNTGSLQFTAKQLHSAAKDAGLHSADIVDLIEAIGKQQASA